MGCQYTPYYPKKCFKIQKKSAILGIQTCLPWGKNDNTILEEKELKVGITYLK